MARTKEDLWPMFEEDHMHHEKTARYDCSGEAVSSTSSTYGKAQPMLLEIYPPTHPDSPTRRSALTAANASASCTKRCRLRRSVDYRIPSGSMGPRKSTHCQHIWELDDNDDNGLHSGKGGSFRRDGMYEGSAEMRWVGEGQMGLGKAGQWELEGGVTIGAPMASNADNGSLAAVRHDELQLLVQSEDVHDAVQAIISLSIAGKGHMYEGEYYHEKAKILAPEYDQCGIVIVQILERSDPWPSRVATARAVELLAPSSTTKEVEPFFKFLIQDEALGDREPDVRRGMLSAGTTIVDLHGASCISSLIAMLEDHMSNPSPSTEAGDYLTEAVVILFGRVARHLDPSGTRIPTIVDRLVEALKTPTEQVQITVSDCLSPLVRLIRLKPPHRRFGECPEVRYSSRRCVWLAGVIKGTGIAGLKGVEGVNVVSRLRAATEDKNSLERLLEPYIAYVLPLLLSLFGDAIPDSVREATQDAAWVIMANMSGYGVKLILPSLLSGLDERQWRTKKGSIELLGMMAYCSPRRLSLLLPIVIPRLMGILRDSHTQVRTAANKSLKQLGEVNNANGSALSLLLKTSFMHYIDHSSLVLDEAYASVARIMPDTKKNAAQIVGNLASLTDLRYFVPYLSELLPMVRIVLVDPVPETRATAANVLGTLVECLGEGHFPDLVPGLLRTLKTDTSGVDQQGAAQGLSEVLSGLGMEHLKGLLPDIVANAQSPRATVREGFMSLLVYLSATFGTRFQPHLPKIITPILSGMSDVEEYVRDAAMRAGRMIIINYSNRAIDLLLPEPERGTFDPGWRLRQWSITLVRELMFKVSGISGKTSDLDEEDVTDASTAESSRRALVGVLGVERRDRLLAALYLLLVVWEILAELISQIITSGRTIAEICRKFSKKIVGKIMTILKGKATSTDSRTREGVCLVLSENIMENSTDTQREDHEDNIISMVRVSLVDDEANLHSAAAKVFDMFQEHMGSKTIDETIHTLL
ncbi:uncharacterized protein ARMOST_21787 [Armillaria ostoyae]|uniref:TOG domain-containing protein n=1 Tax=Armillaria ostoyae TaxID=47428 RepID=A0A284SB66_ARMOS|nr:uncharacterized protein ARMOST_21787 [Armillaria ostoyae]